MCSMSQVRVFLRGGSVQPLKQILSPSCEGDEARVAYSSCLWYDSRCRNAAERHGGERVPDRHERCSPDAGRVHWAARSAVRNRYVLDHARPEVVG